MFPQYKRLTGKDIAYMTKQRNVIFTKYFSFCVIPQYKNKERNQISFHITPRLHKSSVQRHNVKRQLSTYIENNTFIDDAIKGKYRKIFITLNKKALPEPGKAEKNQEKILAQLIIASFPAAWEEATGRFSQLQRR